VTLGLCSQIDLDNEVKKAARRLERERAEQRKPLEKEGTLLPAAETTGVPGLGPQPDMEILAPKPVEEKHEESEAEEEARVFAKLRDLGTQKPEQPPE
jgi:hypothetical protein